MKRRFSLLLALILIVSLADVALASGGRRRASGSPERLEGVITAVATNQLTIRTARDDRQVNLTSSTIVKLNGQKTNANVLQVGDKVEVNANKAADGTLTALKVEVDNDMDVSGVVKSVSATELTITTKNGDATFTLTPDTVVLLHGVRATTAALATGVKVEVHWFAGTGDTRVARLIEVHTDLVETEGIVTAISADSITVQPRAGGDPVTIAITPDTVVRMDGHQTSPGTIAIGSKVEVKSVRNADNTLTAVLIQVDNPNDLTEVQGEVTAVSADSITVKTRSGDEVTFVVNADTIVRIDDRTAAIGDVRVGDHVEIDATSAGTTLTAVRIKVENEDDRFVEVKGTISDIAGSVLTVQTKKGPVTVSLTSTTTFRGGLASDLAVGTVVDITARRNADGSLEALNVEIEGGRDDVNNRLVEIKGSITAVDSSSITVSTRTGSMTAAIDASTVVQNGDKTGTVGDLKTGQRVEIKAQRNPDNTLLAKFIKVVD